MKLSDYKNEEALDLLAELIEPASKIMSDKNVQKLIKGKNKTGVVKTIIKSHKSEIIEILAILDGVPVDQYECNVLSLPIKLLELLNDKELVNFFTSQEWTEDETAFIAPMENTKEKEQ